jgi:hypothetical protein
MHNGNFFLKKKGKREEKGEEHAVSPLGLLRRLITSCAAVAGFVCDIEDLNASQRLTTDQRNFTVGTILV